MGICNVAREAVFETGTHKDRRMNQATCRQNNVCDMRSEKRFPCLVLPSPSLVNRQDFNTNFAKSFPELEPWKF